MIKIEEQDRQPLFSALYNRGIYDSNNPFHNLDGIDKEPETSKYKYKISVYKWNTRSSKLIVVGARIDKNGKWILSTYKTGSTKRYRHSGI